MPEPLAYETPPEHRVKQSRYAIASLAIACAIMGWLVISRIDEYLPFDVFTQPWIAALGSIVGVILACASRRRRHRRQWLPYVAVIASVLAFLFSFLSTPPIEFFR